MPGQDGRTVERDLLDKIKLVSHSDELYKIRIGRGTEVHQSDSTTRRLSSFEQAKKTARRIERTHPSDDEGP
jgi:hypothetical protein